MIKLENDSLYMSVTCMNYMNALRSVVLIKPNVPNSFFARKMSENPKLLNPVLTLNVFSP